jgi:hypothetical protein
MRRWKGKKKAERSEEWSGEGRNEASRGGERGNVDGWRDRGETKERRRKKRIVSFCLKMYENDNRRRKRGRTAFVPSAASSSSVS